jgi:hypothetical protein
MAGFDASGERIMANTAVIIDEHSFDKEIEAGQSVVFCGTGTVKCEDVLKNPAIIHFPMQCRAEHLVIPALRAYCEQEFADLVDFRPDYVKAPNITVSTKPLL